MSSWRTIALRSAALAMGLLLAACGTIPRETGPIRLAGATLTRTADPRIDPDDAEALQKIAISVQTAAQRAGHKPVVLAISGGGANGAYGAGIIAGWTARGDRPQFDLVSGVSTGALAAPFAFLGRDWDDEMREAYTGGQTAGLMQWRGMAALLAPSLFSPRELSDLVDERITAELLRQIAVEHAKGRRLLVVTTNLDAEHGVIWDMGLIATQGDHSALILFRQVLLASASIPGVFPPVLIAGVTADGSIVREMHVDGGVTIPFLASPRGPILATAADAASGVVSGQVYIILNGQSERHYAVTAGRLPAILGRAYTASSKATTARELAAAASYAHASNLELFITEIPDGVESSSFNFDPESMTRLFDLGRSRAQGGDAWKQIR